MAIFDIKSIEREIADACKSVISETDGERNASLAAGKFIEVLRAEIESCGIATGTGGDGNGFSALTNITHTSPYKIGNDTYAVEVYFSDDLSRPSLYPEQYSGINNIAALLNNGYEARDYVYGEWHGERIRSRKSLGGMHFMQSAKRNFEGNYGSEYNVVDVELNDIYE